MFSFLKRKNKNISTNSKQIEITEDISITAQQVRQRILNDFYNPTYEQIKKRYFKIEKLLFN